MPSTENTETELIKVFFYGTLKREQPNSDHLLNKNVTFLSEAITADKYPLIVASDFNVPFMLNKKGFGKHVHGEMFLIDKDAKEYFDEFEAVHLNLYSLELINVSDKKTNQIHQVFAYLVNDFKQELLNEKTILFENYSSINDFYPVYQKREDTPQNFRVLYDAVKAQ